MRPLRRLAVLFPLLLLASATIAQVRQIDRAKLPQIPAVLAAYDDLLPVDQYARNYESTWRFPIPKQQLALRFQQDLKTLEDAQHTHPDNAELRLLTGLTAHLAYNLDVNRAYQVAMDDLQAALTPTDPRPAWFLAMNQCESNNIQGGMQRLLDDEAAHPVLPAAFQSDFMICASVSLMPAHVLRAYDTLAKLRPPTPGETALADATRRQVKPSSITAVYPSHEAWDANEIGKEVRFTSTLCGESFSTPSTAQVDIHDVKDGTCVVLLTPGQYPSRTGTNSPTLLLYTRPAAPGETLASFLHTMLTNPKYAAAHPIQDLPCPVSTCLADEIVTPTLYAEEGGAHLLALVLASEQPADPGLNLEFPHAPPKAEANTTAPTFFRPGEVHERLPGTLFTFLALDANADIYLRSRADFEALLKSLVIDSR